MFSLKLQLLGDFFFFRKHPRHWKRISDPQVSHQSPTTDYLFRAERKGDQTHQTRKKEEGEGRGQGGTILFQLNYAKESSVQNCYEKSH